MARPSYFKIMVCIELLLICNLNETAYTAVLNNASENKYVNSISFNYEGQSRDYFNFTIFNITNTTKFQLTAFSEKCLPGIYVINYESYNDSLPTYMNATQPINIKTVTIDENKNSFYAPIAQVSTYLLTNGEYYVYAEASGEGCITNISFSGNTGQYGVDPCEHLFTYPIQSNEFPFSNNTGKFLVSSPLNCQWSAQTGNDWITIIQGDSNNGPGIVEYSVTQNIFKQPRSGSISIHKKVYQVNQEGHKTYLPFTPLLMKKNN